MPRGDGSGPMGQGPLTGRGMGPCDRGFGNRGNFGRGCGRRFASRMSLQPQQPNKEQEQENLEQDLKTLEMEEERLNKEKDSMKKRLEELRQ
ncbi:MAG: DUF5320 domain-containing protein [archaeon]